MTELSRSASGGAEGEVVLTALREHTQQLAAEMSGALRRIRVCAGDIAVEVEWQEPAAIVAAAPATAVATVTAPPAAEQAGVPAVPAVAAEEELVTVPAPMLGTFYHAPTPGADPFVSVGDHVDVGQTIGIVEAMKLMNPITSDVAGVVVEIVAGNAEAVHYGQPLLLLRPER